jgi:hypothetical protein
MVQAADFGELHDFACREDLDRPEIALSVLPRCLRWKLQNCSTRSMSG